MTAMFTQRSLWDDPPPADKPTPEDDPPPADTIAGLHAAFERRVLQGLAAEWENAVWLLPENLRLDFCDYFLA